MIELPASCLRQRSDCEPLAQIKEDDAPGFICCGLNDGTTRAEPQDVFRLCWKGAHLDEMTDWDRRDLLDTASVMLQALSIQANMEDA